LEKRGWQEKLWKPEANITFLPNNMKNKSKELKPDGDMRDPRLKHLGFIHWMDGTWEFERLSRKMFYLLVCFKLA
jgi:hypothetical protein